MSDPFIAEVRIVPFNFAPRSWAFCNGQLLPISQNTALFALIGTFYGGDGKTTFALPNLQGRTPIGAGQGPGLSDYSIGESGGAATVTLVPSELPVHTHTVQAATDPASGGSPGNTDVLAGGVLYGTAQNLVPMDPIGAPAQPHNNRQPFLTLNFCICLQGIFPSRN
jgi:microcystin-dependent protein